MAERTVYQNGILFVDGQFVSGSFSVCGNTFEEVVISGTADTDVACASSKNDTVIDLNGSHVIPGLIDLHIHGALGSDFSDAKKEGLAAMADYLASQGVTSFLPTTMTLPLKQYLEIGEMLNEFDRDKYSRILGMRMEGPFLSYEKRGAQNPDYLAKPDFEFFRQIQNVSENAVRILDIAPEVPDALSFIQNVSDAYSVNTTLSIGHTTADYDTSVKAFKNGASHLTHLFNAMPSLHHRTPGPIGALFDHPECTAEIIGDGIHVHPAVLRTVFQICSGRVALISDGLRCVGMPEGTYELSGQTVTLKEGAAYLESGTLAGSASTLYDVLKKVISFGISKETAITAATEVPARILHNESIGKIEKGRFADFILCDENLNRKCVYRNGRPYAKE